MRIYTILSLDTYGTGADLYISAAWRAAVAAAAPPSPSLLPPPPSTIVKHEYLRWIHVGLGIQPYLMFLQSCQTEGCKLANFVTNLSDYANLKSQI